MALKHTNSKGKTYILHAKETTLKNGHQRKLFFFASDEKEGALDAVPTGYVIHESKNGLPVLKRADKA